MEAGKGVHFSMLIQPGAFLLGRLQGSCPMYNEFVSSQLRVKHLEYQIAALIMRVLKSHLQRTRSLEAFAGYRLSLLARG